MLALFSLLPIRRVYLISNEYAAADVKICNTAIKFRTTCCTWLHPYPWATRATKMQCRQYWFALLNGNVWQKKTLYIKKMCVAFFSCHHHNICMLRQGGELYCIPKPWDLTYLQLIRAPHVLHYDEPTSLIWDKNVKIRVSATLITWSTDNYR